jgi:hypothetical protein
MLLRAVHARVFQVRKALANACAWILRHLAPPDGLSGGYCTSDPIWMRLPSVGLPSPAPCRPPPPELRSQSAHTSDAEKTRHAWLDGGRVSCGPGTVGVVFATVGPRASHRREVFVSVCYLTTTSARRKNPANMARGPQGDALPGIVLSAVDSSWKRIPTAGSGRLDWTG